MAFYSSTGVAKMGRATSPSARRDVERAGFSATSTSLLENRRLTKLNTHPNEWTEGYKKTCPTVLMENLFLRALNWKRPECLPVEKQKQTAVCSRGKIKRVT